VPKRISDRCIQIGEEGLRSLDTIRTVNTARSTGMLADMCLSLARVLGAVFVLSLLAVPSAVAAPGWLAPASVSEAGHQASEPRVAFDGRGDAVATWQGEDGTLEDGAQKIR
jgi:hypothetical protein